VRIRLFPTVVATTACALLAACAGGQPAASPTPTAAATSPATGTSKIAVAYDPPGRGDAGFNDITYAGLERAVADFGLELKEVTAASNATDAQREELLGLLAQSGYNPVIAVGYAFANALSTVAGQYPGTSFAIVDTEVSGDNIASLVFAAEQGSYLVGVIAASASQSGHIGFVGGQDIPLVKAFYAGFKQGAESINAEIQIDTAYLGAAGDDTAWNVPDKAKAATAAMIGEGADVVYHAAGTSGLGVFQAVKAAGKGHWAIGVDTDQYNEKALADYKDYILTSMQKRIDTAAYDLVKSVTAGNPLVGLQTFDLAQDGVGYSTSNPAVKPYQAAADAAAAAIKAGSITVAPQ
jgi:basic membrane protein A